MQIDWFTFFAQIVNFLILLFVLKRILYGPLVHMIDEREASIKARFEEAQQSLRQAQAEGDMFSHQRHELQKQRDALLAEAASEADEYRNALMLKARHETETIQNQWYAAIEHEKQVFLQELRTRMGKQLVAMVQRSLADLADVGLETVIIDGFIRQIERLDLPAPAHPLSDESEVETIMVRTTFPCTETIQERIACALQDCFSAQNTAAAVDIRFEQSANLICGIEAQVRSRHIGWNVRDYLQMFEDELNQALTVEHEVPENTLLYESALATGVILPA